MEIEVGRGGYCCEEGKGSEAGLLVRVLYVRKKKGNNKKDMMMALFSRASGRMHAAFARRGLFFFPPNLFLFSLPTRQN